LRSGGFLNKFILFRLFYALIFNIVVGHLYLLCNCLAGNYDSILCKQPVFTQKFSSILVEVANQIIVQKGIILMYKFGFPESYAV